MPNVHLVVDNQTSVYVMVRFYGYREHLSSFDRWLRIAPRTEAQVPVKEQTTRIVLEHGYTTVWIVVSGPNEDRGPKLRIRPALDHSMDIDLKGRGDAADITCRFTVSNYENEQADVRLRITNAAEGRV